MANKNKHPGEMEGNTECEICLADILVDDDYSKGGVIVCYECETEYTITSMDPVRISLLDDYFGADDDYGEMMFDD